MRYDTSTDFDENHRIYSAALTSDLEQHWTKTSKNRKSKRIGKKSKLNFMVGTKSPM